MRKTSLSAVLVATLLSMSAASAQTVVVAKQGETVETGSEARQILLKDKSSVTAGANSAVRIGNYQGQSQIVSGGTAIEVTKGAFRFVSGTAKPEAYKIKTPLATIGVRGTIIEGLIESEAEMFLLIEGAFEICTTRECANVTVPGTYTLVTRDGKISTPVSCDAQMLEVNAANDLVQGCLYQHINGTAPRPRNCRYVPGPSIVIPNDTDCAVNPQFCTRYQLPAPPPICD